jgi:putative ABC transport system permease protein
MDLASVIRMAFQALRRNTMRTALTMLGITIGITAVICTVAIGQGGSNEIREQMLSLGENFVWIEAGGRNVNGVRTGFGETSSLVLGDMKAMLDTVPLLKSCSPQVDGRIQVVYANQNWNTSFRSVSPEFLQIRRFTIAEGSVFSTEDVEASANVALIGHTVAQYLFPEESPIGKTMRVRDIPFKVIGVLAPKGLAANGNDQDDFILIPYTTGMHKVKGADWLDDILCSAVSPEAVRPAQEQVTLLLRERHHIFAAQMDDFNIRSPEEILKAREDASRTLTIMLASVASVSLLVGGIGIMNIMLVSVTERTREIGVRMAVGATERDVRLQFLAEAAVLSLLGGAFGVFTGIFAARILSGLLQWPTILSPQTIVIAVLFSAGTGIFFGYYPAHKAARLDPIEALRFE